MTQDIHHVDPAAAVFGAVLAASLEGDGRRGLSDKTLADLGWERIREALADRCAGDDARELCQGMGFLPTGSIAARRRAEVHELTSTLRNDEAPPLRGVTPVGEALMRARKHDVLAGELLRGVADSIEAAGRVADYVERRDASLRLLGEHASRLVRLPALSREIRRCFDPSGELADSASPALGRLRRRVASLRTDIQRRIDRILKAPRFDGILQDEYVTIRDERYVVPVRSGERGDFPGIVHGQSGSGATMFIEPEELIGPNNELRVAQLDVENEERRILTELSALVRQHADELETNGDILTYLDITSASARLAVDLDMHLPEVTSARGGTCELLRARHPVLALRQLAGELQVVPNDIVFDARAHVLVVSGPNTGGKTVTLKTIGLFSLMLRAGLPVPCDPDASVPEFVRIFSDIGDEQAVEHDLSTFSGHVRNIARFLPDCDGDSLVLLDELFAGTDPEQGAALGRALLDELAARGCWVVVTTHLEELKTLAFQDDRYACASMGFDVDRLEPTYRLRAGVPGSSYALRIARRLGLSPTVVERASSMMGETISAGRDALIERLEREHIALEEARSAADAARADADALQRRLQSRLDELARADRRMVDEEAKQMLDDLRRARDEVRRVREHVRDAGSVSAADAEDAARRLDEARRVARAVQERTRTEAAESRATTSGVRAQVALGDLSEGDRVWVRPFARDGTVVEIDGERVSVQLGVMRASFDVSDLRTSVAADAPAPRTPTVRVDASRDASNTLDLRGTRADEAIEQLDAWLDSLARSGAYNGYVVHGHGTGALKRAVRSHLGDVPWDVTFRPGERGEGGDGVTVVYFGAEG